MQPVHDDGVEVVAVPDAPQSGTKRAIRPSGPVYRNGANGATVWRWTKHPRSAMIFGWSGQTKTGKRHRRQMTGLPLTLTSTRTYISERLRPGGLGAFSEEHSVPFPDV